MKILFESSINNDELTNVVFVSEKLDFPSDLAKSATSNGFSLPQVAKHFSFHGKKGESFTYIIGKTFCIFIGIGKRSDLNINHVPMLGGKTLATLNAYKVHKTAILIDTLGINSSENYDIAANFALGMKLRSYRFDKYKTQQKPEDKPKLNEIHIVLEHSKEAQKEWKKLEAIADGVTVTRNLVSEPPNVIYPESFEKKCWELEKLGVEIEVLDEEKMHALGMGALLGVGQGSVRESRVVIMQYWGGSKNSAPLAFLGKGVTFDTGGISLKPSGGMEDMKYDMGGAGVVTGLMHTLASRKAKVNVVGVIGLVENMPDGNAQRPSDVVHSMSGQTIEVLNTDAEGRLVLADILWYTQDRFKPEFMINLATLTGAITIALGSIYAGLFSNDDELAEKLYDTGMKTSEKLWRFPLGDEYDRMINSEVADMQNISNEKGAGSITAAQFLKRFVNDTPWAHLDIAGVTWTRKDLDLSPKGATAFGVRLLNQLVEDYYE
ncbi:MAG: leucyl aminopeptidase [Alphaproteobacteria bacterium]|nr:leucyl aminopeptidase [Alphaproteobacteria bacterium]OJV15129.1 MAG: leucyl aminopeptidase [Alphaproteobacteria bacterium 33-17]